MRMTQMAIDAVAPAAPPDLSLRLMPWGEFLSRTSGGWEALTRSAADPNPFYEDWALVPAIGAFGHERHVDIAALWRGGELAGLLPLSQAWRYANYPLPHRHNWLHANAFCGAPLIAPGAEHAFWELLLAELDRGAGTSLFLHLSEFPRDTAAWRALRDVLVGQARPAAVVHEIERASLASDLSPDAYFEASTSGKKRKELRRQYNRLADEGAVAFARSTDGAGLCGWIDAFLDLEAAGWKGEAGSALASAGRTARMFRRTLEGAAAAGRLERLTLTLDGRPIAMLANFIVPPGAYSFKTAYDEKMARFSPGVLLQRENLALLARDDIDWCDSCAAADHPMIERIWREKRSVARVSIAIGGRARRALAQRLFRAETRGQCREFMP